MQTMALPAFESRIYPEAEEAPAAQYHPSDMIRFPFLENGYASTTSRNRRLRECADKLPFISKRSIHLTSHHRANIL